MDRSMDGYSSLVSGIMLSSVVPAKSTGDDKVQKLSSMDLVMKLHYIKGIYFFGASDEVSRLSTYELKKPLFPLLELYYVASGRIRRSENDGGRSRPFIRCNDSGVRIIEAESEKTIYQWIDDKSLRNSDLVYTQPLGLGPDLGYSPLVFIQFTRFKCGGLAVGLSWAHVLGDFFSASTFMNMMGQIMKANHQCLPVGSLHFPHPKPASSFTGSSHSLRSSTPSSIDRVETIGDLWIASSNSKMVTRSFRITQEQLDRIFADVVARLNNLHHDYRNRLSCFEILSAIFWKSLSKIREEETDSVSNTISIYSTKCPNRDGEILRNDLVISGVEAAAVSVIADADEADLARLILEKSMDESEEIEELVESETEEFDFVAYGARLTFVNLEKANLYGFELNGQRPFLVNYELGGVSDKGVVLILPGPPIDDGGEGGRVVTVILPETQLADLTIELQKQWEIV